MSNIAIAAIPAWATAGEWRVSDAPLRRARSPRLWDIQVEIGPLVDSRGGD